MWWHARVWVGAVGASPVARGMTSLYPPLMKTAISLPDELFEKAEQVAARLQVSRSELYARALAAYLREHDGARITREIDRVLGDQPARLDPVLTRVQLASLGPDEGSLEDWVALDDRRRGTRG